MTDLQAELEDTKTALKASSHFQTCRLVMMVTCSYHCIVDILTLIFSNHNDCHLSVAIRITLTKTTESDRGGLAGERETES